MEDNGVKLIRYEAACRALAEAQRVDDVKDIRDKAVAMQIYAMQAKDRSLIDPATELRLRAEIRAGELLKEMAEKGERQKPGDNPQGRNGSGSRPLAPTLSDIGVTKSQSSRWQRLAALPPEEQEHRIARAKKKASSVIEGAGRIKKAGKQPRTKVPKKVEQHGHMTPIERCALNVRAEVLGAMDEMQATEWPDLFQDLRSELESLEDIAKQRRANGNDGRNPQHNQSAQATSR